MTEITKAERDELRAFMHKWRGGHWLHPEHPIYQSVCDGLPRLLAALEAAETDAADLLDAMRRSGEILGVRADETFAMACRRVRADLDAAEDQRNAAEKWECKAWGERNGALAQRDRAEAERDALQAKLDLAEGSLGSLRNAINDFDGVDRSRVIKLPVGRAIGIIADQRADLATTRAKLDALVHSIAFPPDLQRVIEQLETFRQDAIGARAAAAHSVECQRTARYVAERCIAAATGKEKP